MSELIGKSLGSYRILEQVGVGGMATIYKAYQPGMDRYVAIKVLPHYLASDEQFVKRFQREARAIAKLEHPHILPVFDYGEQGGITYIAMRYVEAGTLKEYMSNGRLPLAEISRIIGQVGGALDYAHRQGIIHRDVKPGNVLIDDQGNTYLTDFGLARMMETSQQFTASGVSVGTPAYMSPEQGKGVKVDHRSDIYALGVVLFEMATGQVPFEAETPLAVLLKHITDPLPLPHMIRPDVPEPVERVILRALAKEPADRFQSANDMAQALATAVRRAANQETIPAKPAPRPSRQPASERTPEPASLITRVQRSWQTPRGKAALIGGTAVLLILFAFLLNWLNRSEVAITESGVETAVTQPTPTTDAAAVTQPTPTTQPTSATAVERPTAPPTPQPTTAPLPTPAQTDEGKRIAMCTGARPLLCIYDVKTNRRVMVSDGLEFERIDGVAWSPDGRQIAFVGVSDAHNRQIYIINADGSDLRPIASSDADGGDVDWSPDGEWIAFTTSAALWLVHPDGSDEQALLLDNTDEREFSMAQWSPDGQQLSFVTKSSIWVVDRDGADPHVVYTSEQPLAGHGGAVWSPDGRQMSILYQEDDEPICLIINADGSGEAQRLDSCPGSWDQTFWPRWGIEYEGEETAATPAKIIAHWPLDGDFTDNTINGFDLQAAGENLDFVPGCFGQAVQFPGDNDSYLTRGQDDDVFDFGDRDYSIELWVKFAQMPSESHEQALIEKCAEGGGCADDGWGLTVLESDTFRFVQNPGPQETADTFLSSNQSDGWRHIAVIRQGETVYLYLNGEQVISIPAYDILESDLPLILGHRAASEQEFPLIGALDEVIIYEGALSAEEVYEHTQEGADCLATGISSALASSPAAQARAFAEPILAAIAGMSPDYEDDFSDPSSGWPSGVGVSGHTSQAEGETGYRDGEYFLSVGGLGGEELACYGGENFASFPADFVLEIDGRFLPDDYPNNDDWQMQFRKWDFGGFYVLTIRQDGYLNLSRYENNERFDLAEQDGAPILAEPGTNHVQIIAVGAETAVYVNGEPLFYVDDAGYSPQYGAGSINLGVCNLGDTAREARWDNLKIWDISNLSPSSESGTTIAADDVQVTQLAVYEGAAGDFAWLPDSQTLVIGGHDLALYDAQTLQSTQKIRTGTARSLAFSPDGTILAWENYEAVHLWDTAGWSELRALAGSSGTNGIAFSPDGATLATATGSAVKLWDVASGDELLTIPAGSSLNTVAFSPDGRTVAAGGLGEIQLWEATTGEELHTLTGHTNWVKSVAFSPDGALLASGSVDGTVRLWDVASGRQTYLLSGHTKQVDSVAFSPDGALLASAAWDLTVRLWEVATGTELETLTGHSDWVHQVAFSPDGTVLASGSTNQTRLWRIER